MKKVLVLTLLVLLFAPGVLAQDVSSGFAIVGSCINSTHLKQSVTIAVDGTDTDIEQEVVPCSLGCLDNGGVYGADCKGVEGNETTGLVGILVAYAVIAIICAYIAMKLDDLIEFSHIIRLFFLIISVIFMLVLTFQAFLISENVVGLNYNLNISTYIYVLFTWVFLFFVGLIGLILIYLWTRKGLDLATGRPRGEKEYG